jgi:hypothetical protein
LEYELGASTEVRLAGAEADGSVEPTVAVSASIAPTVAAGGAPLPHGSWYVRAAVIVAGFSANADIRHGKRALVVSTTPPGRIVAGEGPPRPPSLRRRVAKRWPLLARAVRRARETAGVTGRP